MTKARKKVYFIMVCHPLQGWMRVGNAYSSKENAKGWVPFVKKSWRGLYTKTVACTLYFEDGKMSEKSVNVLDKKFNMDAPVTLFLDGKMDMKKEIKTTSCCDAEIGQTIIDYYTKEKKYCCEKCGKECDSKGKTYG